MPILKLALDRSARHIDVDGRMHVDRSHISRAAVNPYYGEEIPGYQELGLDPKRVYRLLRDPVELERAAPTFARIYILKKHIPLTVGNIADDPELKKLIVGTIGSNVIFEFPYLDADLCIWDAESIAGIESEEIKELSCAYRYVPVMEPGEFEGQPYDGRMTEIQANHLAPVEIGRAGADVVVADANPFKESAMKMTKLGKALFAALCAASPVLAADSALPALVGPANRKNFDTAGVKAKLMALDATLDPQQLDRVIDALLDVEQAESPEAIVPPPAVGDEGPCDKIKAMLAGKVDDAVIEQICALIAPPAAAEDEKPEPGMKKEEVEAAMDGLRKTLRDAEEARRDVRPVVGDVSASIDSAAEVYGFALDQMKVDHKDVEGTPALRALFRVAHVSKGQGATPRIAQDADAMAKQFPGAARFRNA